VSAQSLALLEGPPVKTVRNGSFDFSVRIDTARAAGVGLFRYVLSARNVSDTAAWLALGPCDAVELRSVRPAVAKVWHESAERTCLNAVAHRVVAPGDSLIVEQFLRESVLHGYLPGGSYTVSIRPPQPRDPRSPSQTPTFSLRLPAGRVRWRT
jgi:hypothetical protein